MRSKKRFLGTISAMIAIFLPAAANAGISISNDPMTDEKIRTLIIPSATQAPNSIGVMEDVHLVIRCKGSQSDVFIVTTTYNADNRRTLIRWDKEEAQEDYWSPSANEDSLFAPSPKTMITRLATANKLAFGWHPYAGGSRSVVFGLGSYRRDIRAMDSVCK